MSDAAAKESLVGICAAIGEDIGFNPDLLRVALAAGLLFAPWAVLGVYAGMGLFVLASRLLFPPVRRAATAEVVTIAPPPLPIATDADAERMREAA